MTTQSKLAAAQALIAQNERDCLAELRAATLTWRDAAVALAERAGAGVLHTTATLNVIRGSASYANETLTMIDAIENEYPTPEGEVEGAPAVTAEA